MLGVLGTGQGWFLVTEIAFDALEVEIGLLGSGLIHVLLVPSKT